MNLDEALEKIISQNQQIEELKKDNENKENLLTTLKQEKEQLTKENERVLQRNTELYLMVDQSANRNSDINNQKKKDSTPRKTSWEDFLN